MVDASPRNNRKQLADCSEPCCCCLFEEGSSSAIIHYRRHAATRERRRVRRMQCFRSLAVVYGQHCAEMMSAINIDKLIHRQLADSYGELFTIQRALIFNWMSELKKNSLVWNSISTKPYLIGLKWNRSLLSISPPYVGLNWKSWNHIQSNGLTNVVPMVE